MITSLLIANRGEIACRIIRTCQAMGIRTVAVYSDADANALHVRQADEAVHIGPSPARESYLVGEKIVAAAKATGAEAIHPGYGFLSENADFAQAVKAAGLIWVGPNPDSIRAMGLKDAAKERMIAAGVPVTPGYLGEDQSPDRLQAEADAIGYPVLIKAVAGGGGKGMRRVDAAAEFRDALASCQREAASSFGDDRVLIEKYILSPRHIEVQVFGDTHGNLVHLFERDCSLQRRHQKVIEEAPAPGMDETTREAICAAAVRAAKAVDYVGAGTIEFIADASEGLRADRIWFMEMNTRLQVEHPVTEEITGVDLVEWQLRVASGEPLPKRQEELAINGWAMEARLYAEDPTTGFLPSIGRLDRLALGTDWDDRQSGQRARIETGVEQGDAISPYYDPMIAKLIVHAKTRANAVELLELTCGQIKVWPVRTNANFLVHLLREPEFIAGGVETGFIAEHADHLTAPPELSPDLDYKVRLWLIDAFPAATGPMGFRLNAPPALDRAVFINGKRHVFDADDGLTALMPSSLTAQFETMGIYKQGEDAVIFSDGLAHHLTFASRASAAGTAGDGAILAPMPGRITVIDTKAGDLVVKGEMLVTLEAMKMEHALRAPFDGTVMFMDLTVGQQVTDGQLLVQVEKVEAAQ
ncbi:ATP-grasp domain-containing protein [Sphingomonas sp. LB-2]|uniref:acetyl/propionyl/methylcrotonyl-CoA carboxylase subunit alpha n=1 Tax=Sphingomonas caeni TaxID=2984949 RepID=UPI00222E314A|nr:biotin carboxylase N-terminal domain-containing protein [Sphingomonas caeni]MCW3849294.1 ATP-grasp domain-containing protein [Sphingomonas caeni]